jgi:hypothetical protein
VTAGRWVKSKKLSVQREEMGRWNPFVKLNVVGPRKLKQRLGNTKQKNSEMCLFEGLKFYS